MNRRRALLAWATAVVVALGVLAPPAHAYPDAPGTVAPDGACEGELRRLHDQARANAGRAALREDPAFDQVPRAWALRLAGTRSLAHNPGYEASIRRVVSGTQRITENVGYASTPAALVQAWLGSSGHTANILDRGVQRVAFGCARDARGTLWATVNFVGASTQVADRRPTPFRSAGDASARLRWWLLAAGSTATQLEADAANLLGSWSAADLAVYLAGSSAHEALVPGTTRLYGGAFDRTPDAAGLVYWIRERQKGTGLERMATMFAASREFAALYGDLDEAEFVAQVYRNVLDREPDDGGTRYWIDQLARGATRGKVIVGFTESAENKKATAADVTVSWAFAQLVARNPSANERPQWVARLEAGATEEDLVRFLVASDGFARRGAAGAY